MDFKFNDIKVKQLKEDFNFNDISTDKEVTFFDSDEFVDTFLEKFRLACYKYYREIFKGIEEHNIDVIKNDHSLNITLHANLLILRTDESTIKFPINHFVGSLVIDESCTNITKFDDSFPRCVTNRLTIRNHITNYKKCPDAHSIVINDKQLTEFDFEQLKHVNNNHFLWFHVYDPTVLSNFKNAAKFLNEHSYTNITVISPAEVNLIEAFGVDEKYYQYESNEVSEGEWQLFLNHRCCEAIPLNEEWKELKENIEFDSIQSTSINDNVITGMYKQKVKKELLNILERYYTTSFFKHVLVTFSNSTFEDYDFDIKYVNCELSNPDEILIGRVRVKTSGIIDKLEVCKFIQSKVMNSVESAPEISTFLYHLINSDFYFNEVHICADSNLCFYFDSFNDYMRLDIKCNFPFKELKEKIKSVTFGFNNDIVSKDDDLLGGIDVYDSATLLFGYGEMHFRKDKEEHMKDIGHLDEFKEFWDVVKIFNVDPQYGIHFIADEQPYKKPYKTFGSVRLTEDVDFDKVLNGNIDYDSMIYNVSLMNDLLKKFEFINQSYISNNDLELKVKGFDVVDQDNQKMFSVIFDNEPYKIKLITFYQYETCSFGIYAQVNNIFGYLCFISELDKYQIDSVMFYQDKKNGVVPYIMKNDFFDLIDDSVNNIIQQIETLKSKDKKQQTPDTWFKQCQRLYPVSEGLKNLKTINFYDYTAELIIDDSIAFKDEADYNNFEKKLSLITKVENCSFYGEKLRDKPKFVH